jgi:hypothetical protein
LLQVGLVSILEDVHAAGEINAVEHFSYNQFYVLYVKFLSLVQQPQQFRLSQSELREFIDADLLTKRMVERIFTVNLAGSSCRKQQEELYMSYTDWVVLVKVR